MSDRSTRGGYCGQLPLPTAHLAMLERTLAEGAAVEDIEDMCPALEVHGVQWRDTRPMLDPRERGPEELDMAHETLAYAEARHLITHHPLQPHLVRVLRRP